MDARVKPGHDTERAANGAPAYPPITATPWISINMPGRAR